jgi:hypothetical protein
MASLLRGPFTRLPLLRGPFIVRPRFAWTADQRFFGGLEPAWNPG